MVRCVYIYIYIKGNLKFSTLNLQMFYKEQGLGIAATHLKINKDTIIVLVFTYLHQQILNILLTNLTIYLTPFTDIIWNI
jgi:peptide deformylase